MQLVRDAGQSSALTGCSNSTIPGIKHSVEGEALGGLSRCSSGVWIAHADLTQRPVHIHDAGGSPVREHSTIVDLAHGRHCRLSDDIKGERCIHTVCSCSAAPLNSTVCSEQPPARCMHQISMRLTVDEDDAARPPIQAHCKQVLLVAYVFTIHSPAHIPTWHRQQPLDRKESPFCANCFQDVTVPKHY